MVTNGPSSGHKGPVESAETARTLSYRDAMTTVACAFCGKAAEDDPPPLTWTSATENGRARWFCDTCSREHLRAMESKLDSEWW